MRLTAKRSRLAEVSSLVAQAVAGKSTKKIFECLRLVAKDGELEIAGTDLEVAVRYRLDKDIEVGTCELDADSELTQTLERLKTKLTQ